MAATNAIYAQDGTAYLRGSYGSDKLWFEAAMGHGGADGCRLEVCPDSGGAYMAAGGTNFIDVPHDNVEVVCAPGANFAIDSSVGGPTTLIRIVAKQNFKWRGGQFLKSGANVTTGQSFFSAAASGGTNCDGLEIRDAEFTVASTSTALNTFNCINILGTSSSEWAARARRCVVDNCKMFSRSVQQATALGTLAGSGTPYSQTRYGGYLLRSRHTSGLKVSNCGIFGDDGTTAGTFNASHWAGGMLWIQNDEGGTFTGLDAFGTSLMASDGTGGTLILIGDDGLGAGEGSHFVLSNSTLHNIKGLFIVDVPKTQYSIITGVQIGRCSADAMIHAYGVGGTQEVGATDSLIITGCEIHNYNRAVYSANGALGSSSATTTKATGGYGIWLEYAKNVNVGPCSFTLTNEGRIGFRAEANCQKNSIRFYANEHVWGFSSATTPFAPVEVPDPEVMYHNNLHQGRGSPWFPHQFV